MLVPRRICSFWNGPFEKVTSFVHFRGASFFSWQPRSFNLKPPQYKVGPSPNITRWAPSPVINGVNQKPISRVFSPQGNPFVRPAIRAITPFNDILMIGRGPPCSGKWRWRQVFCSGCPRQDHGYSILVLVVTIACPKLNIENVFLQGSLAVFHLPGWWLSSERNTEKQHEKLSDAPNMSSCDQNRPPRWLYTTYIPLIYCQ